MKHEQKTAQKSQLKRESQPHPVGILSLKKNVSFFKSASATTKNTQRLPLNSQIPITNVTLTT